MQQGRVIELSTPLALAAARVSLRHRIPAGDSIMLASAHAYGATLWSQDADFDGIAGVKYISKQAPG